MFLLNCLFRKAFIHSEDKLAKIDVYFMKKSNVKKMKYRRELIFLCVTSYTNMFLSVLDTEALGH